MTPEEAMFNAVMEAIDQGDRMRARDLLARLLKNEKNNVDYWLWMSAVVETAGERIYCLKEVLRLDPKQPAARRGLAILGVVPSDEKNAVPLKQQRIDWKTEKISSSGLLAFFAAPRWLQGGLIFGLGVLVIALIGAGGLAIQKYFLPSMILSGELQNPFAITENQRVTPYPTLTFTGPTPLWVALKVTYTPTPLYVNTPHPRTENYRAALRAMQKEDWQAMISYLNKQLEEEPEAADLIYYLGEAYRRQGKNNEAITQYGQAIRINPNFAGAYLGRGRAWYASSGNHVKNARADLKLAVSIDPELWEADLELARIALDANDPASANDYLANVEEIEPRSALLYLYKARSDLISGNPESAWENAQKALSLDMTMLEAYRLAGEAGIKIGNPQAAKGVLATYALYHSEDDQVLAWLGQAYLAGDDTDLALETFRKAIQKNPNQFDAYLWRGVIYYTQGKFRKARPDFEKAIEISPRSFEANYYNGLTAYKDNDAGNAYYSLSVAEGLAENDGQKGQVYYWRAQALQQLGENRAAIRDWQKLLELPGGAITDEWVKFAKSQLADLVSATPVLSLATSTASPATSSTVPTTPKKTSAPGTTKIKMTPVPGLPTP